MAAAPALLLRNLNAYRGPVLVADAEVVSKGLGVFAMWIDDNDPRAPSAPCVRRPIENAVKQGGHRGRLPGTGRSEHGAMLPEHLVDVRARDGRFRPDIAAQFNHWIFAVGALLFVMTLVMNIISIRLVRKYREVYD